MWRSGCLEGDMVDDESRSHGGLVSHEELGVTCSCVETPEGQLGPGCASDVNWRWVIVGAMVYNVQGITEEIGDLTVL